MRASTLPIKYEKGREENDFNQEFWLYMREIHHVCLPGHFQSGKASSSLPSLFVSCNTHKYPIAPKKTFKQFLMSRTKLQRNSESMGPWELRETWKSIIPKIKNLKIELDDILEICL